MIDCFVFYRFWLFCRNKMFTFHHTFCDLVMFHCRKEKTSSICWINWVNIPEKWVWPSGNRKRLASRLRSWSSKRNRDKSTIDLKKSERRRRYSVIIIGVETNTLPAFSAWTVSRFDCGSRDSRHYGTDIPWWLHSLESTPRSWREGVNFGVWIPV